MAEQETDLLLQKNIIKGNFLGVLLLLLLISEAITWFYHRSQGWFQVLDHPTSVRYSISLLKCQIRYGLATHISFVPPSAVASCRQDSTVDQRVYGQCFVFFPLLIFRVNFLNQVPSENVTLASSHFIGIFLCHQHMPNIRVMLRI